MQCCYMIGLLDAGDLWNCPFEADFLVLRTLETVYLLCEPHATDTLKNMEYAGWLSFGCVEWGQWLYFMSKGQFYKAGLVNGSIQQGELYYARPSENRQAWKRLMMIRQDATA